MANKIQVKRSAVPTKQPTTADLDLGEIAINTYDGKMYIKKDDGTASIVEIGAGGGTSAYTRYTYTATSGQTTFSATYTVGYVTVYVNGVFLAPADYTATNGTTIVLASGATTGDIVDIIAYTLTAIPTVDAANITGEFPAIQFDTTPATTPTAPGSVYWDSGNQAPSINLNANTTLQLGQENVALVYNGSGATIANGSVVAVSGAQGQRPSVVLADADTEALSAATLGIATESIANGAEGFICTFGLVRGLDTSAFSAGAPIYLSQTAGQFTATRPAAPAHTVFLGWVIKVNASSGEVFVNISNGWELDELHNVLITNPLNGQVLAYDATTGVWINTTLAPSSSGAQGFVTMFTGANVSPGSANDSFALI